MCTIGVPGVEGRVFAGNYIRPATGAFIGVRLYCTWASFHRTGIPGSNQRQRATFNDILSYSNPRGPERLLNVFRWRQILGNIVVSGAKRFYVKTQSRHKAFSPSLFAVIDLIRRDYIEMSSS